MTTYEPCGFRAKRTGALTPNLDSAYEYGVRQPNGRRLTEEQWEAWIAETYEVVYRITQRDQLSPEVATPPLPDGRKQWDI